MTRAAFDVISVYGCLRARAVPGSVITAILTDRGWTASNVRNQITRLVERGLLAKEKNGRHSVYSMASELLPRFQALSGSAEIPRYEGFYFAVFYSIPERERGARDRLLYVARYREFELLRPGVLIGLVDVADEIVKQVGVVNGESWILSGRITPSNPSEAKKMAAIAFASTETWERIERIKKAAAEVANDESVSINRYFDVFYDASREIVQLPHLPANLVDGPRPESELSNVMSQLVHTYIERYHQRVQATADAASGAELIEYETANR